MPEAADNSHWLNTVTQSSVVDDVRAGLETGSRVVAQGSRGSSTTLLAGALAVGLDRPVVLAVAHLDEADDALEDLALFDQAGIELPCERLSALEVLPGESAVSLELLAERLALVQKLMQLRQDGEHWPGVIVAPIQALMQAIPEPSALADWFLTISEGLQLSPNQLVNWLTDAGYRRVDVIEEVGDFAMRGGIVDIYPPTAESGAIPGPIRVDYFGDEIDTLSVIDPDTMGSSGSVKSVSLVGADSGKLQSDERTTSFLKLVPEHAIVMLHEVLELSEQGRGYYERLTNPRGIFSPQAVLQALTKRSHVEVNQYSSAGDDDLTVDLPVAPLASFAQEAGDAVRELAALTETGRVHVVCGKNAEAERLAQLLGEHAPDRAPDVAMSVGYLHRGFVWREGDKPLHLVPHHELFHRYETRRRVRQVSSQMTGAEATDAFFDLAPGDHVVHEEHGIAIFQGLRTMTRGGRKEEYLTLEFAERAKLHVSVSQINLVQKYIGGFQGRPPLSVIGGKRWTKQKEAAAESAKELARQMLQLQAARAALPGVRYPGDTAWQAEFEAEFPFQETEDQLAAVAAIKRDLADEQPMDRLICGDVGFGKTEVAMRAAFKVAEFGKQVAVLVPTTILAEQHERTFRERFADYPFQIASLSRFKSPKQQKETLEQIQLGQIDIVIGTHRILSKDVKFSDLGLIVVDEEQRFGVEHKNRLFEFRLTADVLTLSATPIPRTLHMAMVGLRDISSLSIAPPDRRSIVTEVIQFDEKRMAQAIARELNREGQVYFIHNRVHNIHAIAAEVQAMAPDARIAVGHGQMPAGELEKVMLRFLRREVDILVCTTIIESGLDIPTANTMFINQADHFGLSDLHQLRGRVGRYKHRAYCYLILPSDRPITDTAARRLKAIEQFSMLGAGFKIAMRDLEIRGAGNLLGKEQSGHIAAVGYEMYCRLLDQKAKKLKQQEAGEPPRTHLDLPIAGWIPKQYISSDKHRMDTYRRIARAANFETLDEVETDLNDAYGDLPDSVRAMFDLAEVRIGAGHLGVRSIALDGPDLIFKVDHPPKLDPVLRDAPGRASVIDDRTVYYRPPENYLDPPSTLLAVLRKLLVRPLREAE